jgi:adenine C2-methylase RlmN of 23S rRNA A2503 and tRNA A37
MSVIPLTTPAAVRPSLFGLRRATLGESLTRQGFPSYRADQIYGWIYQKHHRSPVGMSNLPSTLKHSLDESFDLALPRVVRRSRPAISSRASSCSSSRTAREWNAYRCRPSAG